MKEILSGIIKETLQNLGIQYEQDIKVEVPKNKENGDFSSNIALELCKILKKNPLEIAENLKNEIKDESILKVEVAAPGFLNFFVNRNYLVENINRVIELDKEYGSCTIGNGKKVNIEFVSANPTGILHLGNARGGAYGDSLARILTFAGFDVTKEYYVNDAGNQINNLGLSIQARYKTLCGIETPIPENGYHGPEIGVIAEQIYEQHKEEYLEKELDYFKELGTEILLGKIKDVLKEYKIDYDVYTSEKSIYKKYSLQEIINTMDKAGYIYEKEGAIWFKSSELYDTKDHVLVKADGSYTYLVPDIAYHIDKFNRGYDKMIDVLGTDHHGYVARLKGSLKANGYDDEKVEVKLLQLVRLVSNGEEIKMSKRTGNTVTLKELIDEVGVNATRYSFSSKSLDTQMDFDLDVAKKKSNENPVYYVSYAYARICTILKNYENIPKVTEYKHVTSPEALDLLEAVYNLPEVVKSAATKELPHLITNYVYNLANLFHTYYSKYRIINDDENILNENLNMIKAVRITLKNALNLIGVEPPEKM